MHQVPAKFTDGQVARGHVVTISTNLDGRSLEIRDDTGRLLASWILADIRQVSDPGGHSITLYLKDDPSEARLHLTRPGDIDALRDIAPNLNATDMTGRLWTKVFVWAGAAAFAFWLMIFVIVPALAGRLAVLIPVEREVALGHIVFKQIESFLGDDDTHWTCTAPKGQAALDKMGRALMGDQTLPYPLQISAVNHEMFNAFALPGGQVVFMRGLLERAETPEQVAGVLAHEIGHVANRDPMRSTLQAAGTAGLVSLLIGDMTGGAGLAMVTEYTINASHTRKAESRADAYALDRMQDANISPQAFAEFFEILMAEVEAENYPEILDWVSTHPASETRAELARAEHDHDHDYGRIITNDEWHAIKTMCKN